MNEKEQTYYYLFIQDTLSALEEEENGNEWNGMIGSVLKEIRNKSKDTAAQIEGVKTEITAVKTEINTP